MVSQTEVNDNGDTQQDPLVTRLSELIWQDADTCPDYRANRILAEFIVIPRSELPDTERDAGAEPFGMTPARLWENARLYISRAYALEAHLSKQAEKVEAEKRNTRRDELAREIGNSSGEDWTYQNFGSYTQRAIDRIIELEAQVQA